MKWSYSNPSILTCHTYLIIINTDINTDILWRFTAYKLLSHPLPHLGLPLALSVRIMLKHMKLLDIQLFCTQPWSPAARMTLVGSQSLCGITTTQDQLPSAMATQPLGNSWVFTMPNDRNISLLPIPAPYTDSASPSFPRSPFPCSGQQSRHPTRTWNGSLLCSLLYKWFS